jgi:DNA-directed RNA polymerase beta subunit
MSDEAFKLIGSYYRNSIGAGISTDSISSFNDFLNNVRYNATKQLKTLDVNGTRYSMNNIYVEKPYITTHGQNSLPLYPKEARMKKLNYSSNIYVDVTEVNEDGSTKIYERINIGSIPIMVGSSVCHFSTMSKQDKIDAGEDPEDYGGYFIINGNERVVISHVRASYNSVMVFQKKLSSKGRTIEKYSYIAESRSMSSETNHSILIQVALTTADKNIVLILPQLKGYIPVGWFFKAVGYSAEDIINLIGIDKENKYIYSILNECSIQNAEIAISHIGSKLKIPEKKADLPNHITNMINNEILPHMGIIPGKLNEKCLYIGKMIHKLILTIEKKRPLDRRDNLSKRRVDNVGSLINTIFNMSLKKFEHDLEERCIKKKNSDPVTIIPTLTSITIPIKKCMSTGNWTLNPKSKTFFLKGVSQLRDNTNRLTQYSHATRVIIPSKKGVKNGDMRLIDPSSYGYFDPIDTPEGEPSGLNLQTSILVRVSHRSDHIMIKELVLENALVEPVVLKNNMNDYTIYINGVIIGTTKYPRELREYMDKLRTLKKIDKDVSLYISDIDRDFVINCDEGRLMRPLFVGKNPIDFSKSFDELVESNHIVFRDSAELENSLVGMKLGDTKYAYNYYEIHPICMFGAVSLIRLSFPANTPSPRNCYSIAMGKSSVMALTSQRYDIKTHSLVEPQSPIVSTMFSRNILNNIKMGVNVVIAIMSYGNNQEDAFIFNRGAVERGMFTSVKREVYSTEEKIEGESKYEIKIIDDDVKRKNYDYSKLDEKGLIKVGSIVAENDVLVSRLLIKTKKDNSIYSDSSLVARDSGVVDKVIEMASPVGYKIVKVVIRNNLIPMVGDKFSSSKAQKGTIGAIVNQEDMPTTLNGITPDIILNPHCIPSRMTQHQLMDILLGKVCVQKGVYGDSTPFTEKDTRITSSVDETMYDGTTGEMYRAKIFFGISSNFDRLKHLSESKCYARARGPITTVTRQPVEGRSRTGGLRIGEMERDALLGEGCSEFLRFDSITERFSLQTCKKCGQVINSNNKCSVCHSIETKTFQTHYTMNVLRHYLESTGIKMAIK